MEIHKATPKPPEFEAVELPYIINMSNIDASDERDIESITQWCGRDGIETKVDRYGFVFLHIPDPTADDPHRVLKAIFAQDWILKAEDGTLSVCSSINDEYFIDEDDSYRMVRVT